MKRIANKGRTAVQCLAAVCAITLLALSAPVAAQSVDGPDTACPGELMRVDWTGPNARGDAITVALVDSAANRFIDAEWTAAGDPAQLQAPTSPGVYQIRYVGGDPREVLARESLTVERCGEDWTTGGGGNWPNVAVLFAGVQVHYGDEIDTSENAYYGQGGMTVDEFCQASEVGGQALNTMVTHIESEMQAEGAPSWDSISAMSGAPTRPSVEQAARTAHEEICDQPPDGDVVQDFVVTYAYCRMNMRTNTQMLDIHLPPGGGPGTMLVVDHAKQEGAVMSLRPNIEETASLLGQGWNEGLSMNGPLQTSIRAGYPVGQYTFDYELGLGGGSAPMGMFAQMVKVKTSGTAWLSSEVPGIEIVRLFYERLTTEMSPQGNAMSFFGGLINNLVSMLQVGVPLEMDQQTKSRAVGVIGVSGRSQHWITGVELLDFDPAWCNQSMMPSGYEIMDVDAEMAQAMGGQDASEYAEAMQEYNEAMSQMTPEQRAMMESMGMTQMMGQATGGSAPAANPAGLSPAAQQNTGCNASSANLTTNDMTQSVQLHLEALGYDPGNTNGDAALQTSIAISQFQAEKGLDVTGEVSPQLLGAIAAEVDARCN